MAGSYRIDAVRYARRDTSTSEVFHRDTAHAPISMDYFVRALTDGARTVVVDFGFTEAVGTVRGRTFLRCPSRRLAELGIDCARVDDEIVSHFHCDHVGSYALFPGATFHVQDTEMAFYTRKVSDGIVEL